MRRISTNFLRFVIFFLGIGVMTLCIFALPEVYRGGSQEYPTASRALFWVIVGMYAAAVPFFIALWHTLKLLKYIDQNKAFSDLSIRALRNIKYCAFAVSVLYVGIIPFLFPIADADDAPGLVVFGAAFAGAPVVVAVFAAVLQRLLQGAIEIKSENDLTV